MSDQLLPDFDGPQPAPEQPSPRKPRPKPMRRPAKKKAVRAPVLKPAKRVAKKRRIRKAMSSKQIVPVTHAGGLFTPEVYRVIGTLMEMKLPDRSLVLSIVDSLSGHK